MTRLVTRTKESSMYASIMVIRNQIISMHSESEKKDVMVVVVHTTDDLQH